MSSFVHDSYLSQYFNVSQTILSVLIFDQKQHSTNRSRVDAFAYGGLNLKEGKQQGTGGVSLRGGNDGASLEKSEPKTNVDKAHNVGPKDHSMKHSAGRVVDAAQKVNTIQKREGNKAIKVSRVCRFHSQIQAW